MDILATLLIVISGATLIVSTNPVYSIANLIAIFINTAVLLLVAELDFLACLLIIIYVGAICVLFLFIIFLLNLRVVEKPSNYGLALATLALGIGGLIYSSERTYVYHYQDIAQIMESVPHMALFTQVYYMNVATFWMIGMILLFALLGCILLTKQVRKNVATNIIYF